VGVGIAPGERLGEVRTIDVAPTLLDWLGIPPPDWMEGRPIAGLVAGPGEGTTRISATAGNGEAR
jgi:arylsulfatase A-like enzyme